MSANDKNGLTADRCPVCRDGYEEINEIPIPDAPRPTRKRKNARRQQKVQFKAQGHQPSRYTMLLVPRTLVTNLN